MRVPVRRCVVAIVGSALVFLPGCGQEDAHSHDLKSAGQWQPALGTGVNFSETKTYRTCVNRVEIEQTPLALSRLYKETRVTNKSELHKTLNISASVSAKGLWGSGQASMSYFNDIDMQDEAFYWLVDANYAVTSEKVITNGSFDLTDAAKSILKNEGLEAFYSACGTHFYSGRRTGGRYTLLYEFNSKQDKVVEKLKARASYAGFGVKASGSFSNFLEMAEKSAILKIHSRITGGGESIKNYANHPDKLEEELQRLRSDLVTARRGEVLEWYITSYDIFEEVQRQRREERYQIVEDSFREDALEAYYELYTDNQRSVRSLDHLVSLSSGEEPVFYFGPDKLDQIREAISKLHTQNDLVRAAAVGCIRGQNTCSLSGLERLHFVQPRPDRDLSQLGRWKIYPNQASQTGIAYIDFFGKPGANFKIRHFKTSRRLMETSLGAVALVDEGASLESVHIGSYTPVVDPRTGLTRPDICTGDFAGTCNLRVVESPAATMDDGYPASKLQLTIFNAEGFIRGKIDFLIEG